MKQLIIYQDAVSGNFNVYGDITSGSVYIFLNGRFDGLNSDTWVNKSMKELKFAPVSKLAQKQVGVITLDLKSNTLNMKGMDYNRTYNVSLAPGKILI